MLKYRAFLIFPLKQRQTAIYNDMEKVEIDTNRWIRQTEAVKVIRERTGNRNFSLPNLNYWIRESKVVSRHIGALNLTLIDKESIPYE